MEITTIELRKLTASEGMTLTNGETYSKEVYLGKNDTPDNWYEITDAEAEEKQKLAKLDNDINIEEFVS